MNIKRNRWLKDIKTDIPQDTYKVEAQKHIRFVLNDKRDGLGGYFIGFDGRKTKYNELTQAEKQDWINQMSEPDIEKKINEYIQKHQQEER